MLEDVRVAIYRSFVTTGAAPLPEELDGGALRELAAAHAIVLDPDGTIAMAHPFSGVPTAFRVESGGVSYFANCAWDAFGIAALLGRDTECHAGIDLSVRGGRPVSTEGVIHFAVPAREFWGDIRYT